MDWVISTLLFIVALGLLICLHELGHFATAKLFNVYCHEFSVGFGPKLLSKKRKDGETVFSLRAIPLGGYVSMYGEEDSENDEKLNIPQTRSIEGIKKWKKAIVVSAGVIVNLVIAIVLFSIKNLCFSDIAVTSILSVQENSIAQTYNIENGDRLDYLKYTKTYIDDDGEMQTVEFNVYSTNSGYVYVIDDDVLINDYHYVLGYTYYTTKSNNQFSFSEIGKQDFSGLQLFTAKLNEDENIKNKAGSATFYVPIFDEDPLHGDVEVSFEVDLQLLRENDDDELTPFTKTIPMTYGKNGFSDVGLSFRIIEIDYTFAERSKQVWVDFGDASIAVFKGLATLFSKGGINQMSGIVGIFTMSEKLYARQTFATYLYFWGLISVNLAIFNLLPFPGLDGWQLLVTAIEGISRKKIPTKFKSIMSLIGFSLIIILMVAILFVDIGRLI